MPIGGYFELELPKGIEFHKNAIKLNSGRNAFEYILRSRGYEKVYIPYYTCDVMMEPILKLNLKFEFYKINYAFQPVFNFSSINYNEAFLYTNYFGICNEQVKEVAKKSINLIVDNSQAFFSKPLPLIDTFYSPRKFFGVPDGGYLYTNCRLEKAFKREVSYKKFDHLLGRVDLSAEEFYKDFKLNDKLLSGQPIKIMSNLTARIMKSINYRRVAQIRRDNFLFVNNYLKQTNKINLDLKKEEVPLVYPYLIEEGSLIKEKLIKNKIFVPTYWPNVFKNVADGSIEFEITNNTVFIPIDQRYQRKDLNRILILLKSGSKNSKVKS